MGIFRYGLTFYKTSFKIMLNTKSKDGKSSLSETYREKGGCRWKPFMGEDR